MLNSALPPCGQRHSLPHRATHGYAADTPRTFLRGASLRHTHLLALLLLLLPAGLPAQFSVGGQLMQRSEYRNGYGKLIARSAEPAVQIGHRARVHVRYDHAKARFHVSVQDARPWGASVQTNTVEPYFSLYEAWAELTLGPSWSVKLGRQELTYDDARFLGNVDWSLAGSSHDFALLRFERKGTKVHAGGGYNVGAESLTEQPYTVGNRYKAAQFLRVEQRLGGFTGSAMLWANGLQQLHTDTAGNVTGRTMRYTYTFGLPTLRYVRGRVTTSAFLYLQLGQDRTGRTVQGHDAGAWVTYALPLDTARGSGFRFTVGAELLSGTAQDATDAVNRSYDPIHSTKHAWNGYMDHFYTGGRWANSVGLFDAHVRLRYDVGRRTFLSLNAHEFHAAAAVLRNGAPMDRRLGTELDLTVGHLLNEVVSLQLGYSHMLPTATLEHLEGVTDPAAMQHWGYLAILYRPGMKDRFTGLRF
ncbi:MAG: alginate export family protein [Flavobacteriales bacterium]|nr:hypothetical protein [Flavobacteriales bacterium]MCC6578511.1 alginate export family protein [Flavobacteriales bacterium]NUQ15047.1 alginate export family protein [Flavobacteriales bacterium]